MITYLMDNHKNLRKTVDGKIYQREKLVDKVQFIIPKEYENQSLSEFTIALKYTDQNNTLHTEILTIDKPDYKEKHFNCLLPVDTKLTRYTGNIKFRLSFIKNDITHNTQYVLHTGEATLEVLPVSDLYNFLPDQSLEFIDQKLAEIDAKIASLDLVHKADDIEISDDKTQITLTAYGEPIGTPILLSDLHDATEEMLDGESLTVVEL